MPLVQTLPGPVSPTARTGPATGVRKAQTLTAGGSDTLDLSLANYFELTFGAGNNTLVFSNIQDGATYTFSLIQDSSGSRTMTWPASVKWVGGSAPTLSTGANKVDDVRFISNGTLLREISRGLDIR